MSPFRRSAEADAFDAALRGASPSPALEPLMRTVEALEQAAGEAPRPQFSADLRDRLMAEAATALQPRPAAPAATTTSRGTRRRLAGAVATAVTVAGGAGLVASSASALPGEVLYPVKRGTEQVQKSLRLSDSARGAFELQQATRRLAEVEALAERDGTQQKAVDDALVDFEKVARSGTDRLMDAYRDDQDTATLQQVDRFVAKTAPTIEKLADRSPGEQDEVVGRVQRLVDELTGTVDRTCPTCLSQESRRLADEVQRQIGGGGSEPRSARSQEQLVGRVPATTPTRTAGRHRSDVRVAIPTTKVPSSGTARHDGRADVRARPTTSAPSARPSAAAPTERPSARDRAQERRTERQAERERRQAEREQRAQQRQAEREQRRAEREQRRAERDQRAQQRRAEQRRRAEARREAAEQRRHQAQERVRQLLGPWASRR